MASSSPIGFTPAEISSRVNLPVVARHADEAAFLWTLRSKAVTEPQYTLKDLVRLDERVEAHAFGLCVSPEAGWSSCEGTLEGAEAGHVFAAGVLAFGLGNRDAMRKVLLAATVAPQATTGLISALGWLEYPTVEPWISRLLDANQPQYRAVGIAACAIHRQDPGDALKVAVHDPDANLRARSLRTIGLLRRRELLDDVSDHLRDPEEQCRFWASWTWALNAEGVDVTALTPWLTNETAHTSRAMQVALRIMDVSEGRDWITSLSRNPDRVRTAVLAAGIVGDPAVVPWLIRRMQSPDTARLAGESFSMITGVDLSYQDLDEEDADATDSEASTLEDRINRGDEANLRRPSADRVQRWWDVNGARFPIGVRHLTGRPISSEHAASVLRTGKQRQRAAAALELALLSPNESLFEVRARGDRQERALKVWS